MDDLQSGKGLAGTVLQNEQLATNVQAIANNLSIATSNLNRLGLWHFLWAHKPAAPTRRATSPTDHDSTLGHPHFVFGPVHRGGYAISQVRPEFVDRAHSGFLACSSASASAAC
jgi:hypothetical protein